MATHRTKQLSVLTMNTVAFAVNFAVWTMFSVIGIKIKQELSLSETEFGLLVATPILTGSLVRLPLGLMTDRFGGRIVYFIQMLLVAIPTYGLSFATEYWQYLAIGLFVGLAGGSFAIGIAYTSAWFPKERQGTAMGIFGAGNAGAAVTNLVAPLILVAYGWRAVPEIYSIAMLVMAVLFWFTTYPDPLHEERKKNKTPFSLAQQLAPLTETRVWRFGLAYYFVFGGFVALALWLPKYYVGEYGLSLKEAALITMFFTLPSGLIRALGGWMSDKWGGSTVTWWVFWVSIICLFLVSYPPTTLTIHGIEGDVSVSLGVGIVTFTVLIFIVGIAQGIGKASVYRELADYYPTNMGSVGGLVGVIGGLGGFSLPIMFGIAADMVGVRSSCFMLMYMVLAGVMIWTWAAAKGEREAILQENEGLRDEMVRDGLVDAKRRRKVWLTDWRPEDEGFWNTTGRAIANRNLWISMPALLLSFSVWVVWSVVVVELPKVGFQFTTSELFWLAALPGLSGAILRLLYSFVVPIFGGRNWAVFSTASLLLPSLWMSVAVQNPDTNYAVFVVIALLCGFGGGNFSSSMANISFFFPKKMQGTALGFNAGVGNLGVAVAQAVVPVVIYGGALFFMGGEAQTMMEGGTEKLVWLQNAGFIWVPFILLSTLAVWFGMNNIRHTKATFAEEAAVFHRKHAWLGSWLYTGTFGSFIGFAVGFPMLLATQFPDSGMVRYAFVGPLVGALIRPLGGWLSDRMGGASLTFWNFGVMTVAMFGVLFFVPGDAYDGNATGFYLLFLLLFLTTGIGNGSVFRMIPIVFHTLHQRWSADKDEAGRALAKHQAETETAVALGFSASIAAFGGFGIPVALAISNALFGNPYFAMTCFGVFHMSCLIATWWWYYRKDAEVSC
ncbi:MAG: MFS transporter [Candidatus Thiodiazotropha sp. (ex Lucinoma borealis)]|nr:MFS transporter [Candidatus Thiodiazotropha sp. (ex Lucinoma borealis)]